MENTKEKDIVERFLGLFLPFKDAGRNSVDDLVVDALDIIALQGENGIYGALMEIVGLAKRARQGNENSVTNQRCDHHHLFTHSGICISCLEEALEMAEKKRTMTDGIIGICSRLELPKQAKRHKEEYIRNFSEVIMHTLRTALTKIVTNRFLTSLEVARSPKDFLTIERKHVKIETLEITETVLPANILRFLEESKILQAIGARQALVVVKQPRKVSFFGFPIQIGLWEGWCRLFIMRLL